MLKTSIAKRQHPSVVSWTRIFDFKGQKTIYSEAYTLSMSKIIHVQIHGVDTPLAIRADKAEEELTAGSPPIRLKLSLKGTLVGEFKGEAVDGWWIEESDEPPSPAAA